MTTRDVIVNIQIQRPVPTPLDDDNGELISSDPVLFERIDAEITRTSSRQPNSSEVVTKIQEVPRIMFQQRDCKEDYYKPREMPIGPISAKEENKQQTQLKLKLAAQFIKISGQDRAVLLNSIKKNISTLKTRFDENLLEDFSDDKLARMLLVDGCSVLQFIYSRVRNELKEFQINNGQASVIQQDLFLMANQIPFGVLEILMDSLPKEGAFNKDAFQSSIHGFIRINLMTPDKYLAGYYWSFYEATKKVPLHLLDILQSALLYGFNQKHKDQKPQDQNRQGCTTFSCFDKIRAIFNNSGEDPDSMEEFKREYFRNIQDLKTAGIELESSKSCCLRDVTFSTFICWFRARLKLPQLIVDDSTGRKLRNLVAYEMCPDNHNSEYGVTSYISFLDLLIDSEEDVKDLRSARILRNHLSSDKEVAKLFNEIGYNVVSDKAYSKEKQKIQRHCDSWWSRTVAQGWEKYFKSPWTLLALLGAMAALALTATQTHFAIHPANPAAPPPL